MERKKDKLINSLFINTEAMKILKDVEKLANAENENYRKFVPSLLVVAANGSGISSYGKLYHQILEKSPILQIRGTTTFLELVFPKNDVIAEKLFFSSPQRAASITNRFYGTMIVSLEEYSDSELLMSQSFQKLLDFVESNKKNIHFIFRILPEFNMKKQLIKKLSAHINLLEVVLEKPNLEAAYKYIEKELEELGYWIDEKVRQKFKNNLLHEMVLREDFDGYRTLQNLLERICYEMAIASNEMTSRMIEKDVLEKLITKYEAENENVTEIRRIGFHF